MCFKTCFTNTAFCYGGAVLAIYIMNVYSDGLLHEKILDSKADINKSNEKKISFISIIHNRKNYSIKLVFKNDNWHFVEDGELKLASGNEEIVSNIIKNQEIVDLLDESNSCIASVLIVPMSIQSINMRSFAVSNGKSITIGRQVDNDICYSLNKNISRKHAAIHIDENGQASVHDLSSGLGIYVNNIKVTSSNLKIGDAISIVGLKIIYLGDFISLNILDSYCKCKLEPYKVIINAPRQGEDNNYTRSPRIIKSIEKGNFEIDSPPALNKSKKLPLIFTMGPSATMAIAMLVSLGLTAANASSGGSVNSIAVSGVTTVTMLIGTFLWPGLLNRYQKKSEKEEEAFRNDQYMKYLKKQDDVLSEKANRNIRLLNDVYYPATETIMSFIDNENLRRRIWERTSSDMDFMHIRLGRGSLPFDVNVVIQKEKFSLLEDPLVNELNKIADKYEALNDVPITCSLLENKTIGFIGKRAELLNSAASIALHLSALHSYDELKMVFIFNEAESKYFDWIRKIPHVWNNERDVRYIGTNTEEVHNIFNNIGEVLKERELKDNEKKENIQMPQYVVFIFDEKLVENEPIMRYLHNSSNNVGISTLFIYGDVDKLPIDCRALVQNDGVKCGIYIKNNNENVFTEFIPDKVNNEQLELFSRNISKLSVKNNSTKVDIPEKLTFLDIYKVGNVKALNINERWNNSLPEKSLAAPIGIQKGGQIFALDVHESYHGPHGLVAGMTGSGKSEFLQAYILSLAINYHPYDVSFILIDFKGGGMANCFDGMPHLAGKITNLSGNQLRRSLISIRAELQKRQKLFSRYNINHIDKYHKLYRENSGELPPMPHLLIISDEFAQLKSQQPEFMKELIDVAQIGRSLGVHMILATQKPAGVVDEQIWGNSRFRVCLKVLDKFDSNEMIKKSDAAAIKLPGRCYVQVGFDEIFEQVQSGYSGCEYIDTSDYIDIEDKTVRNIDNCANVLHQAKGETGGNSSGLTQLEAIVEHIKKVAYGSSIKPISLWLEPLPSVISLDAIEDFSGQSFDGSTWHKNQEWLNPVIGYADLPEEQLQFPLKAQLGSKGHIAVFGGSGTGKTTFLQTLIYSLAYTYSPDEFNLYVIDLGGRTLGCYANLPHCGSVVYADNEAGIASIIEGLYNEIEKRKIMFSSVNAGGIESYITATGKTIPGIVLCIDNYIVFHERFSRLEDLLIEIARDGRTYGIYLAVTGTTKNSIYYRLTDYFKNFFVLEMNDDFAYREILGPVNGLKPEAAAGRGVTISGSPVEFQTALAVKEQNEAIRINQLSRLINEMNLAWKGNKPSLLDNVEEDSDIIVAENANSILIYKSDRKNSIPLVNVDENSLFVGMDTVKKAEQAVELRKVFSLFIGGQKNSGKTNALKSILLSASKYPQREIVIIDNHTKELQSFSKNINAKMYVHTAEEFDEYIEALKKTVNERQQFYNEIKETLQDEGDIYGCMQMFTKYFIAIDDFRNFYEMITDSALEELEKLIKLMKGLNIYFIITADFCNLRELFSGQILYKYLVESGKGIILRGNVDKQTCISFEEMSAVDRKKSLSLGRGFLFDNDSYKEIEIPYYHEGD